MKNKEPLQDIIALNGKRSKGGLQSYDEMKTNNIKQVRGDLLAATFKAKVTFACDSITFNTACVNLFPHSQHIVVNVDEKNKRVIIEPCKFYDRDSLKFANFKDNKNNPRKCMTRIFCAMIYSMMEWDNAKKYRVMAIFQKWGKKQIVVFNLDENLPVVSTFVSSDDGSKKRVSAVLMPEEWEGRFGHTREELEIKNKIDITNTLVTIDNQTGERHVNHISAKLPTPEELMHRPYGGMRPRQEVDDNEGQ